MEWFVFALLVPAFFAMNGVLGKILIEKRFRKPFPLSMFLLLIDLIFVVPVLIFAPVDYVYPYSLVIIFVGLIMVFPFWFYCKAVLIEEVSRISSLTQIIPILVAVLSALFLNEILVFRQYIGIVLIVIASMSISYRKVKSGKRLSPALKFILVYTFWVALYIIFMKYMLNYMNYWSFFFWNITGSLMALPLFLTIPRIRKDFLKIIPMIDKKTVAAGILTESLWFFGHMSSLIAASLGPISLVSAVGSIEPLFSLIYATALSLFVPKILKEEVTRFNVSQKLFAILLIFIGMWMLNIF